MSAKVFTHTIIALLLILGVCGCNDSPTRSEPDPTAIRGYVTDASGAAISGAAIALNYDYPYFKPNITIEFSVPEPTYMHVWITPEGSQELIRELVNGIMIQGVHGIPWHGHDDAGRVVLEGSYTVHIEGGAVSQTHDLFVFQGAVYADVNNPTDIRSMDQTNGAGYFEFSQEDLALGREISWYPGTYTIPRNMRLWAVHPGYQSGFSATLTVDPDTGADFTIVLQANE